MDDGATDHFLTIPDSGDEPGFASWLKAGLDVLRGFAPDPEAVFPLLQEEETPARLRAFVLGTFLADLACYPASADQVDLPRLQHVMRTFPRGFRLWGAEVPEVGWLPVGYTGFYPIAETTFDILERHASSLRDRSVLPLPHLDPGGSFVYVFNFSIIPQLRGTVASKKLVKALAADIGALSVRGLAAITVSPEGARVVEGFGMRRTGTLVVDGCEEGVFTLRGGRDS